MAVVRNVVAGHHREWRDAGSAATGEPGKDEAEHRARRVRRGGVGGDVGMPGVECARGRVDEIAALGDGQRDDADGRIGEPFDGRGGVARHDVVDHRADDACRAVSGVLLDDGGQPVLRGQPVAPGPLALEDAGADDRPVAVHAAVEQRIEIDRLVRAVEIANAEMQDAGRQVGARIDRRSHGVGQVLQGGERKADRHQFIQFPPSTL